MSEKEKQKKQIQEMANTYYEAMLKAAETLGGMNEGAPKWYAKAFYNAGYRKTFDVAREIFEEIENVINNELQNNYKVLPQFEFSNELWNKMSGRIEALKEICDFIAELKKKYTEERSENGTY